VQWPLSLSPHRLRSLRRTVWAFVRCRTNTPATDFCRPVRINCSFLSPVFRTSGRSPEVSSTAFRTQPPNLQPVPNAPGAAGRGFARAAAAAAERPCDNWARAALNVVRRRAWLPSSERDSARRSRRASAAFRGSLPAAGQEQGNNRRARSVVRGNAPGSAGRRFRTRRGPRGGGTNVRARATYASPNPVSREFGAASSTEWRLFVDLDL